MELVSSNIQTKEWRKQQKWYTCIKKNICEKYQKELFKQITSYDLKSTGKRFNKDTLELEINRNPMVHRDGLEWTEDFDGEFTVDNSKYLVNLKFVCDNGGAQKRTIQLTYEMIKYQLEFLVKNKNSQMVFINILDGDTCYKYRKNIEYLVSKERYKEVENLFYGDMKDFQEWWNIQINK